MIQTRQIIKDKSTTLTYSYVGAWIIFPILAAFEDAAQNPGQVLVLLDRLLRMPPHQLWPLANSLVASIKCLLQPGIPRKVLGEENTCLFIRKFLCHKLISEVISATFFVCLVYSLHNIVSNTVVFNSFPSNIKDAFIA